MVWAKSQLIKTAQTARLTEKGSESNGITGLESANGLMLTQMGIYDLIP